MSRIDVFQRLLRLLATTLLLPAPMSALAGQWTERPLHGDFTPGESTAIDLDLDGFDDVVVGTTRGVLLLKQQGDDLTASEIVAQTSDVPARITFDDFDGDGDLDMAAALRPANDYVIKLYDNTGVGFVGAGDVPNTRDAAGLLSSGDMDGDGDADLLYDSRWHENLNGSWQYHTAPCNTGQLVDVDADGDPDVLCSGSSLSWYSNDGTGVFVGPTYIDAAHHNDVRSVDMDGDGDLDLVSRYSSEVRYVENLGAAVYATTLVDALPSGSVGSVAAVDVDRDGMLDVVASTTVDGIRLLRWYPQLPGGGFGPSVDLGIPGGSPIGVDVDHDGGDELVVTSSHFVLSAELDDQPASLSILPAAFSMRDLVFVDLDGDGSEEVFTQTSGVYGTVTADALWNVGFRHAFSSPVPFYYEFSIADLHSDGTTDLIGTRNSNLIHIYEVPPAPAPPTRLELDLGPSYSTRQAGTGDVDGDGDTDLVVEGYYQYQYQILWFEALGAGQMAPPQVLEAGTPDDSYKLELLDLDNDGDLDLVAWTHPALSWLENLGGGALAPRQDLVTGPGERHFLDHDGDGDLDLVAANVDANTVVLYENDGAAGFSPSAMLLLALECGGMQAGDVDSDGDIDVVCFDRVLVGYQFVYSVRVYENTGGNQLAAGLLVHQRTTTPELHLADVDHDGDLDLLVHGTQDSRLVVIENGFVDTDADGVSDANDCAPTDPLRHPGATEVCNGLDDDCDGVVPADELDADADTFKLCEGDCDDAAATTFPGAPELCGDGLDNDCDGAPLDDELDLDGDGQAACEGDCDDTAPNVYVGALEICGNGVDDDCDGTPPLDEIDLDGDSWAICDGDCDDTNGLVYPGAPELCADGLDSDCDGTPPIDELDLDGDGYAACDGDCDDFDATAHPGALELCDGVDQDCDELIDIGAPDMDLDGQCDALDPCPVDPQDDSDGDGVCDGVDLCLGNDVFGDLDGDGLCEDGFYDACDGDDASGDADGDGHCLLSAGPVVVVHDCDDGDGTVYPGAPELCDGKDNACNGSLPVEDADGDGDGVSICGGDCDDTEALRFPGNPEACDGLDNDCDGVVPAIELDIDGDGMSACGGDCGPLDATIWAGAPELCDGLDNDCDEIVPDDELDVDGDAFLACAGDCDDDLAWVRPGNPEVCDGLDNDCDGVVPDEELDGDGDGVSACAGDCDDDEATVAPGQVEVCDGLDNDCDGVIPVDELDLDADGVSECAGDCDDANSDLYPSNQEACDDVDNDCDGDIDEGCPDPDEAVGDEGGCNVSGTGGSGPLALLALLSVTRRRSWRRDQISSPAQ